MIPAATARVASGARIATPRLDLRNSPIPPSAGPAAPAWPLVALGFLPMEPSLSRSPGTGGPSAGASGILRLAKLGVAIRSGTTVVARAGLAAAATTPVTGPPGPPGSPDAGAPSRVLPPWPGAAAVPGPIAASSPGSSGTDTTWVAVVASLPDTGPGPLASAADRSRAPGSAA